MSWAQLQAEPAFGFTVVGLIIVFGPLIAEKLRLPGLLGLLVLGAVVGPNVLDLFPSFSTLRAGVGKKPATTASMPREVRVPVEKSWSNASPTRTRSADSHARSKGPSWPLIPGTVR